MRACLALSMRLLANATANAVKVDPTRLPTMTFVPLTLPGVTPVAAWALGQSQVGLAFDDPRFGRFGVNEGPGNGDSPPTNLRFDSASPIHGRLITNRKGEMAVAVPGEPRSLSSGCTTASPWGSSAHHTASLRNKPKRSRRRCALRVQPVAAAALQRAIDACRAASHVHFVNAQATTVGAIHAITGGPNPNAHPWRSVFANEPADAFAAWCWRETSPHVYRSYVVGPRGAANYFGNNIGGNGEPAPAPGPLAVT